MECGFMVFMRRTSGFQSLQTGRGWLVAAAFAALLPGCGSEGMDGCPIICFPDFDKPTTVSWQNQRYTVVTSTTGTEPVTLEAIVRVEAFYLLPTDVVVVEPNAPNQNPGPDATSYPVVVVDVDKPAGQAVVRFAVRVVSDAGSYPKGEFPFTATFRHGEDVVTATTTLVVQ
jgi:hypothetical protein